MSMVNRSRCMAPKDRSVLGGPRCQAPATHDTIFGRHCAVHVEELRRSMRDPNTALNVLCDRGRSEEEIAKLIKELPS